MQGQCVAMKMIHSIMRTQEVSTVAKDEYEKWRQYNFIMKVQQMLIYSNIWIKKNKLIVEEGLYWF